MGTSSSYRSPDSPRWNVFNRALNSQLPLSRIRVTLFLAGDAEWRDALKAPALSSFAEVLLKAHGSLGERFAGSDQPAAVVAAVVAEARDALFDHAYSPALPVAERALRTVLVQIAQDPVPLADASGSQAARAWLHNRGEPNDLVRRYFGELFGQWSTHVLARDTARLIGPGADYTAADVRDLTRAVSRQVADLAVSAPRDIPGRDVGAHWQEMVSAVFDQGRRLEHSK